MKRDSRSIPTTHGLTPGDPMNARISMIDTVPADYLASAKPAWTFLTNHAHVLLCVAQRPGIRVREVAQSVGVTERCVQRILAELEEAGYVTREHQGRRNHYEVHADLPLRHPAEQHQQVSALLNLVLGGHGRERENER